MLASRFFALGAMTVTCALGSSGCMVHRVPPPPTPSAELPPSMESDAEDAPAGEPNTSRVTITTDVPARVIHVADVYAVTIKRRGRRHLNDVICERTPCTTTLPYGHQELKLVALDDDGRVSKVIVPIAEPRVAINHTLGQYRSSKARIGGMLIVLAGAALVGIGLGLDDAPRARAIGIGAGAIVGGGLVWGLSHETFQEGATTQWSPHPASPPTTTEKSKGAVIGTSLGFRF